MTAPRCGCCTRPVATLDLLCCGCWALVPLDLRRAFRLAAARAGRHYGTQGWRQIAEAKDVIAAVNAKRLRRTEQARALNPELF